MGVEEVTGRDTGNATHLRVLADALRPLADRVTEGDGQPALEALVGIAVAHVPGARCASLTLRRGGRFTTEAATDDTAREADRLQQRLGCGPGMDAATHPAGYLGIHLAAVRWPRWARAAHDELGVASVLWQRLAVLDDPSAVAVLNVYSDDPEAFDERAAGLGLVLASHGSLLVTATLARGRATNLMRALESNREIGVAIGILMQRHRISRDAAFDVLRAASQDSNRKLSAVASEVADTGILTVEPRRVPSPHATRPT